MFGGWKWKCKNHDFFECAKPKSVSPHVRSVAERKGTVSKLLEAKKSIQLQLLFIGPLVRFGFEKNPSHFTFQFFCKINFNTIIILAGWLAGWLLAWAQQQQQSEIHFFHKNQNFDSFTSASKFENSSETKQKENKQRHQKFMFRIFFSLFPSFLFNKMICFFNSSRPPSLLIKSVKCDRRLKEFRRVWLRL